VILVVNDSSQAELAHVGDEMLCSEIQKLINSIWKKEELADQWTESLIVSICRKGDKTDSNIYRGIRLLPIS
jgi:hypothetical protein